MTGQHTMAKPRPQRRPPGHRLTAVGITLAVVGVVPAVCLASSVGATSTVGALKSVGCTPMATESPQSRPPSSLKERGGQLQVGRVVVPATTRHPGAWRPAPAAA